MSFGGYKVKPKACPVQWAVARKSDLASGKPVKRFGRFENGPV